MLAFNFHIGDFAKKTMHLTHEERGIYLALLMRYYDTESPLPTNTEQVARLVCARNADAMRVVCDVLEEFFVLHDDGWRNARADEEIAAYQSKRDKARKSAKARWGAASRPKKCEGEGGESHNEGNASAMRTHIEGNANHEPRTTNHSNTPHSPPEGDECAPDDVPEPDRRDEAFDLFWSAGMAKTNKRKAKATFKRICGKNPMAFAQHLHDDIQARLAAGQLGFDRMHPTTYLNGERWNDEVQHGTTQERRLSPAEEVERAIAEQNRQRNRGGPMGLAEDDGNVRRSVDEGARGGTTYDMEPGTW